MSEYLITDCMIHPTELIIFALFQQKHEVFSAYIWVAVKKYHKWTQVGIEPTTSWLLDKITRQ